MSNRRMRLFVLLAALMVTSAAQAAGALNPGRWEITLQTVSPIVSAPVVTEICISKEEAELTPEPPRSKQSDDCQVTGSFRGKSLKYKTKCNRRNSTADVDITYDGDTYEGTVAITIDGREIRQIYKAKRIGDCEGSR